MSKESLAQISVKHYRNFHFSICSQWWLNKLMHFKISHKLISRSQCLLHFIMYENPERASMCTCMFICIQWLSDTALLLHLLCKKKKTTYYCNIHSCSQLRQRKLFNWNSPIFSRDINFLFFFLRLQGFSSWEEDFFPPKISYFVQSSWSLFWFWLGLS